MHRVVLPFTLYAGLLCTQLVCLFLSAVTLPTGTNQVFKYYSLVGLLSECHICISFLSLSSTSRSHAQDTPLSLPSCSLCLLSHNIQLSLCYFPFCGYQLVPNLFHVAQLDVAMETVVLTIITMPCIRLLTIFKQCIKSAACMANQPANWPGRSGKESSYVCTQCVRRL